MELALTIIAGFGVLLFIAGFLAYMIAGFKHHFVTGIISMLPVLNIVTVPSLWHNSRGKVITAFMGLVIAATAWFMGADKGVQNILSARITNNHNTETVILSTQPSDSEVASTSSAFDENKMEGLPAKALYKMSFDSVPLDKISTLKGRIVQIINTKNEQIEGRIKSVTSGSVLLDNGTENEIAIANIKQLRLMVKKAK